MRYLSREKIYKKVDPFKDAKKIYIFCEGDREVNYFRFFQGFASNLDILPIPNDNGKSDPVKLKQNSELLLLGNDTIAPKLKLSEELNDEVWFVIDTDRWNEGNKIDVLKEFTMERTNASNGWFVVQSNPSFELWLYFHFNNDEPKPEEVSAFSSFKEYVNSKIKGGFDNRSMPLAVQNATEVAEQNFKLQNEQPALYSTEVFKLSKQIIRFIRSELNHCIEALKSASNLKDSDEGKFPQ